MKVWQEPFDELRAPILTNLRMDPFERARQEDAMGYQRWWIEHMFAIAPAHVRYGSLTDITERIKDVRFTPKSRLVHPRRRCLLRAISGHTCPASYSL